jgi:hypothetical protein
VLKESSNTMATEDFPVVNDILSGAMSNASVDIDERIYPPTDENVVSRMCKYLLDHKRIPMQANRDKIIWNLLRRNAHFAKILSVGL